MASIRAPYPFNTVLSRFSAHLVDGFIFWPVQFLLAFLTASSSAMWRAASDLILWTSFLLYTVLMHGRYGQTLGKMFCSVRVIDISGAPLTMKQSPLRHSVIIALTFLALALTTTAQLLGIPLDDHVYPAAPHPPLFLCLKWVVFSLLMGWTLAETAVTLLNKRRRAIHDLIARSVVIRYP